MIEQLDIVVRSNLPSRHRRLVGCLIGWFATVLLILLANTYAAWGRSWIPESLGLWLLWFSQFGWLLLLYLFGATIYHTGKLIMPCTNNHPLAFVLLMLCFVPILQIAIGLDVCIWIARECRELGIDTTWRGLPESALARLVGIKYCRGCGYDLTGKKSGVCSECGKAIEAALS